MAEESLDYSSMSTEDLIALEKDYETRYIQFNTRQMALKILLNSLYGSLGNAGFLMYDLALAESVTKSGKLSIKWIERKLNEAMDKMTGISKDRVVLIDTDSVVLNLEDVVKQRCPESATREQKLDYLNAICEKVFDPYIDKCYVELADYMNAYQQKMHMKRENIINVMISCAAKSYMMEVYNSEGVQYTLENPYMKIMGIRTQKRDTPKDIRALLKDSLKIALHGTEKEYQDFVAECRKKYMEMTVDQIAIPKGVSTIDAFRRNLFEERMKHARGAARAAMEAKIDPTNELYIKGTPIHVKASLLYNEKIKQLGMTAVRQPVVAGELIHFVYLKNPNPLRENVFGFKDGWSESFGLDKYVDYDMMFEKTFNAIAQGIIDPLGWSTTPKASLDDWFC